MEEFTLDNIDFTQEAVSQVPNLINSFPHLKSLTFKSVKPWDEIFNQLSDSEHPFINTLQQIEITSCVIDDTTFETIEWLNTYLSQFTNCKTFTLTGLKLGEHFYLLDCLKQGTTVSLPLNGFEYEMYGLMHHVIDFENIENLDLNNNWSLYAGVVRMKN